MCSAWLVWAVTAPGLVQPAEVDGHVCAAAMSVRHRRALIAFYYANLRRLIGRGRGEGRQRVCHSLLPHSRAMVAFHYADVTLIGLGRRVYHPSLWILAMGRRVAVPKTVCGVVW